MSFYPADAAVPSGLRTADLLLEMLSPDHVELDYEAVMESQEQLRRFSNGSWPAPDFTLAENLKDLEDHAREFRDREAFTYTVLNHDRNRCEGCVYIYPWQATLSHRDVDASIEDVNLADNEATVTFWIRDRGLERDLDRQLVAGLLEWFDREWAFSRVTVMTNDNMPRQLEILAEVGCETRYVFDSVTGNTRWYFVSRPSR